MPVSKAPKSLKARRSSSWNSTENPRRAVRAQLSGGGRDGSSGTISFEYLIDASGRNGLMSTKYLRKPLAQPELEEHRDVGILERLRCLRGRDGESGRPVFEALQDESGWAWFIPLHGNRTSVGIVMAQDVVLSKKRAKGNSVVPSTENFYAEQLATMAPNITKLIKGGKLIEDTIRSASDFSYSAPFLCRASLPHCGRRWRSAHSHLKLLKKQTKVRRSLHRPVLFQRSTSCIHKWSICCSINLRRYAWALRRKYGSNLAHGKFCCLIYEVCKIAHFQNCRINFRTDSWSLY